MKIFDYLLKALLWLLKTIPIFFVVYTLNLYLGIGLIFWLSLIIVAVLTTIGEHFYDILYKNNWVQIGQPGKGVSKGINWGNINTKNQEFIEHNKKQQITNQKLWELAGNIVEKQKQIAFSEKDVNWKTVDWKLLEELWFDYLEEEFIEHNKNKTTQPDDDFTEEWFS